MKKSKSSSSSRESSLSNYQRAVLIVIYALIPPAFLALVFLIWLHLVLYPPFPKMTPFAEKCKTLQGREYTFETINELKGNCFEAVGNSGSHAVACRPEHITKFGKLTVSEYPGAPEGWYCRIENQGQKITKSEPEFVTD